VRHKEAPIEKHIAEVPRIPLKRGVKLVAEDRKNAPGREELRRIRGERGDSEVAEQIQREDHCIGDAFAVVNVRGFSESREKDGARFSEMRPEKGDFSPSGKGKHCGDSALPPVLNPRRGGSFVKRFLLVEANVAAAHSVRTLLHLPFGVPYGSERGTPRVALPPVLRREKRNLPYPPVLHADDQIAGCGKGGKRRYEQQKEHQKNRDAQKAHGERRTTGPAYRPSLRQALPTVRGARSPRLMHVH